ncbi:MAG: DinB family protein [Anaerolineaceae bacterium]|nr:DinB family protein [Anaerolineaceae bacterium]
MDNHSLKMLFEYNQYANEMVLQVINQMDQDAMVKESSPSHNTVLKLLNHMLDCENFFLSLCSGEKYLAEEYDTGGRISTAWKGLSKQMLVYLDHISENDLMQIKEMDASGERIFHLPVWQFLTQALYHSHHHRGECSIILTQLGYPLPTMDIILFFLEKSGQKWLSQAHTEGSV